MKTLVLSLLIVMSLPVLALADDDYASYKSQRETTTSASDSSSAMTNDEAREIAKSPEYAELRHRNAAAGDGELPRTASVIPLLAVIGAGALTGALSMRASRRSPLAS